MNDTKSKMAQLATITGGAVIVHNAVSSAINTVVQNVCETVTAYSAQEQAERRLQIVFTATQNAVETLIILLIQKEARMFVHGG